MAKPPPESALQSTSCMCRACELLAQRGLAQVTGCLRFLKCSQRAITSQCQVLSIAHNSGIVQLFPQDYSPFQRCQLGRFCVQSPTVCSPRKLEVQFVWDACVCRTVAAVPCRRGTVVALMAEAPGAHMHRVRAQVTAGDSPSCPCGHQSWLEGGWCSHSGFLQKPGFKHSLRNWQLPQRSCPSNRSDT